MTRKTRKIDPELLDGRHTPKDLRDVDLRGASLMDIELSNADLRGADLRKAELTVVTFLGCDLRGADLRGASFEEVRLLGCEVEGLDLRGTDPTSLVLHHCEGEPNRGDGPLVMWGSEVDRDTYLRLVTGDARGVRLRGKLDLPDMVDMTGADLEGCTLKGRTLNSVTLAGANLRGVQFQNAELGWCDLSGADLSGANLHGAYLDHCDLTGACLDGVKLTGTVMHECTIVRTSLRRIRTDKHTRLSRIVDVDWSGEDLRKVMTEVLVDEGMERVDLRGADLRGVAMSSVSGLMHCDLRDVSGRGLSLYDTTVEGCRFEGADLRDSHLLFMDGTPASIAQARLRGATLQLDLEGLDLSGCDLREVNFEDSGLRGTILRGADLRGATFHFMHHEDLVDIDFTGTKIDGTTFRDDGVSEPLRFDGAIGTPVVGGVVR